MNHVITFYALQLGICWFALRWGGWPEKLVAGALLGAALVISLSAILWRHSFRSVDTAFLYVDIALLVALLVIAAVANRFWPIWLCALHVIAVAVHGVKAYQPDLVPWMYAAALGKIAYPMLALLAIGIERHRRRRARYGSDPDWSPRATW